MIRTSMKCIYGKRIILNSHTQLRFNDLFWLFDIEFIGHVFSIANIHDNHFTKMRKYMSFSSLKLNRK